MQNTLTQAEGHYTEMVYFPTTLSAQILVLISAVATTTVVMIALIFKLYKRPLSLMVIAINVADALFCYSKLSVLVFQPHSDLHCGILSIINVFGIESSAIWSAIFAHAFYITLKYQSINEIPRMMKYYVIVTIILPIINGVVSFLIKHLVYSETQKTCVHLLYSDHIDIALFIYVIFPLAFACLASIIWYKMAISKISALQEIQSGAELYVLMIYPGILIFCWGPSLVLHTSIQLGATPSSVLIQICSILVNIQGILDVVVYGSSIRHLLTNSTKNFSKKGSSKEELTFVEPQISDDKNERGMSIDSYSILSVQDEYEVNRNQ